MAGGRPGAAERASPLALTRSPPVPLFTSPHCLLSSLGLWKAQPITLFPKGLFPSQRRKRPGLIRYPASYSSTECSENLSQKYQGWKVTLRSPQSSEGWLSYVCPGWDRLQGPSPRLPGEMHAVAETLKPQVPAPPAPPRSPVTLSSTQTGTRGPSSPSLFGHRLPGAVGTCVVTGSEGWEPPAPRGSRSQTPRGCLGLPGGYRP